MPEKIFWSGAMGVPPLHRREPIIIITGDAVKRSNNYLGLPEERDFLTKTFLLIRSIQISA
jgi:hypothetical protein